MRQKYAVLIQQLSDIWNILLLHLFLTMKKMTQRVWLIKLMPLQWRGQGLPSEQEDQNKEENEETSRENAKNNRKMSKIEMFLSCPTGS